MTKLIVPAEVKICATCSFWDGARKVDSEIGVVVVEEETHGACMVKDDRSLRAMTNEFEYDPNCLWEHLVPDEADLILKPA